MGGEQKNSGNRTGGALRRREKGFTAFKLKVGFGEARDLANLDAMRGALGGDAMLMVDANQAWDLASAGAMAERLERFELAWLEEPMRADAPTTMVACGGFTSTLRTGRPRLTNSYETGARPCAAKACSI